MVQIMQFYCTWLYHNPSVFFVHQQKLPFIRLTTLEIHTNPIFWYLYRLKFWRCTCSASSRSVASYPSSSLHRFQYVTQPSVQVVAFTLGLLPFWLPLTSDTGHPSREQPPGIKSSRNTSNQVPINVTLWLKQCLRSAEKHTLCWFCS